MMEMTLIYTMGGAVESSYGADNAPVAETPLYGVSGFTPLNADYSTGWPAWPPAAAAGTRLNVVLRRNSPQRRRNDQPDPTPTI